MAQYGYMEGQYAGLFIKMAASLCPSRSYALSNKTSSSHQEVTLTSWRPAVGLGHGIRCR